MARAITNHSIFIYREKEKEMQSVLREIVSYIIFLYVLLMVAYGSKDPWTFIVYRNQQNCLDYGLGDMYEVMKEGPGYEFTKPLPMSKVCAQRLYTVIKGAKFFLADGRVRGKVAIGEPTCASVGLTEPFLNLTAFTFPTPAES